MTSFAIDISNKKSPFIMKGCATIDEAAVYGEASDAKDYVTCSLAKLGDMFSLMELATMFNALPGEAKVERFADKASAVRRVTEKYAGAAEELEQKATGKKAKKAKAKKANGKPRGEPRKIEGKIKAVKNDEKRWQEGSPRSIAYAYLLAEGAMAVEDFVNNVAKKQKLERKQVMAIIQKLLGVKMVTVD